MARFRFLCKGIMCDAYEPKTKPARGTALFLYGFPATIGENRATTWLQACGFLVVQPHYPGTYDSEGLFSPSAAVDAISIVAEAIATGEVFDVKENSTRSTPSKVGVLVGYSFGCMVALRALPNLPHLCSLILVSPAVSYGPAPIPSGFNDGGIEFLDYLRRSRPFTYRLGNEASWHDLYAGKLNQPTGRVPQSLKSVTGVVGGHDEWFDLPLLQQNFIALMRNYVGVDPAVNLLKVDEGDHSVNSLMQSDIAATLSATIIECQPI